MGELVACTIIIFAGIQFFQQVTSSFFNEGSNNNDYERPSRSRRY